MKTDNKVFCKERTYILECLIRQDADYFLQGDWYDMFYSSTINLYEDGDIEIKIAIPAIQAVIKGAVGKFIDMDDLFKGAYNSIHSDKVDLYIEDRSIYVINLESGDLPIKLKRDVRRAIVKKMREAFNNRSHILEAQEFNDRNIYDGDDVIGFRG